MTSVIRVAAVDDHPIVLDAFEGWVTAAESGIRVVGTATTVDGLLSGPGRDGGRRPAGSRPRGRDHR